MSPASLVAEATASRAIPRSKHGLDLAYETGSAVVTWAKTKYRYPLSPRFFPVSGDKGSDQFGVKISFKNEDQRIWSGFMTYCP
jgi:hypothetical protein